MVIRGVMRYRAELLNEKYGIYSVRGIWLAGLSIFPTRSFIINPGAGKGILVIDTCGPGSGRIIAGAMRDAGLDPADITGIALTHWHKDHTGGLAELVSEAAGAGAGRIKIFIHSQDSGRLKSGKGCFIRMHPHLKLFAYHSPGRMPAAGTCELVELDESTGNPLGQWGVEFIHTPGHTPGNTSFFHGESGSLFSGCGLSLLGESMVGIVPVFYDREKQISSAEKLMSLDFTYLYPAHMNLRRDSIRPDERVRFTGKVPLVDRITGSLPLFRYGRRQGDQ